MTKFAEFIRDDAGAVTIDWVALTAGILLLGIAVVYGLFDGGVTTLTESVNEALGNAAENVGEVGEGLESPDQEGFAQ